jgi:molecular chaperone GrpE
MKRKKQDESTEPEDQVTGEGAKDAEDTLESVRTQRDEYLDLWRRAQADYKNLRRRGLADLEAGVRRSMLPLLENLLLVLDYLDMALSTPTPNEETKNFAIGVQMTRDQFLAALRQEEVVEIPTDGAFDPDLHQAVAVVEAEDAEPGAIVETVRKGYTWRGSVLRHAQVRVVAGQKIAGPGGDPADEQEVIEDAPDDAMRAAERD